MAIQALFPLANLGLGIFLAIAILTSDAKRMVMPAVVHEDFFSAGSSLACLNSFPLSPSLPEESAADGFATTLPLEGTSQPASDLGKTIADLENLPILHQKDMSIKKRPFKDGECLYACLNSNCHSKVLGSKIELEAFSPNKNGIIFAIHLFIHIPETMPAKSSMVTREGQQAIFELMDLLGGGEVETNITEFADDILQAKDGWIWQMDFQNVQVNGFFIGTVLTLMFFPPGWNH